MKTNDVATDLTKSQQLINLLLTYKSIVLSLKTIDVVKIYMDPIYMADLTPFFFVSNAFFQLSFSVALLFHELSLNCRLSVAY